MVTYKDVPVKKNSEAVHPGHPAIIDTALLADGSKKLKAGTILKPGSDGHTVEAAAPSAVLAEDSDGKNAEVLALYHGMWL